MNLSRGCAALNWLINFIIFFGCCVSLIQPAWADTVIWPESIIVVTSNQRPVSNISKVSLNTDGVQPIIQILSLDAVSNIEQRLSEGLSVDPLQARIMTDQRISQIGSSQLDTELRTAYLPLGTMMAYALDRYPVIIFDQQLVIYGVTDLALAMNRYRQWVEDKQGKGFNE
ncbi:TIGR03757 family integrating conjugative element protein [Dasania marina]|uniref:TIGR03757 family integrating conjugative element protein n=1 Tax=Dasania marina TaxID=471499 RepID=UPI0030DCC2B9|tara:strand:+ start:10278 stop:10790 length:513 start_codon:yes stop_codon:yes gene_type:complete